MYINTKRNEAIHSVSRLHVIKSAFKCTRLINQINVFTTTLFLLTNTTLYFYFVENVAVKSSTRHAHARLQSVLQLNACFSGIASLLSKFVKDPSFCNMISSWLLLCHLPSIFTLKNTYVSHICDTRSRNSLSLFPSHTTPLIKLI